jgi:hypothetical protein
MSDERGVRRNGRHPRPRAAILEGWMRGARAVAWGGCVSALVAACAKQYGAAEPEPSPSADASDDRAAIDSGVADADADAAPTRCKWDTPFDLPVALAGINTAVDEATPRLSPDELTIYFDRQRFANGGLDILVAQRPTRVAPFGNVRLVTELDTADDEAHAFVSDDGLGVLFSRRPDGGTWDLFGSQRGSTADVFFPPVQLPQVQTPANEQQPFSTLSSLWFASDRDDAGTAIYRASFNKVTVFDLPALVGLAGSAGADEAPVLSGDELTLYFSGTRPGSAKSDIYVAHRTGTSEAFGTPARVVELSSAGADAPGWLSPDGCRLYLSSSRAGFSDLFVAERAP